jgi:hypothetical protein
MPQPMSQPTIAKPSRHGLLLTIVGLVLTTVGLVALIELFPRLSASANSPTNLDDPLSSSKFSISNDGYMKVTDVMSACFLWKVRMAQGGRVNTFVDSGLATTVRPPENMLKPTEAFTVPCTGNRLVGAPPPYSQPVLVQADLAIVAYYRVWPFTFYRDHRLFRFVASIGKNNEIVWEKQPSNLLEADYDEWIAAHGGTFPPILPTRPHFP